MPVRRLKTYLDHNNINYALINHTRAYTAQETAEVAHVSGKIMVKTVIVNIDGEMAMIVVSAYVRIDMYVLADMTWSRQARLASEAELKRLFPDCSPGAMPPFGNLYHMPVYVSTQVLGRREIVFNAGNHRELIQMKLSDFRRLVNPQIVDLTSAMAGSRGM